MPKATPKSYNSHPMSRPTPYSRDLPPLNPSTAVGTPKRMHWQPTTPPPTTPPPHSRNEKVDGQHPTVSWLPENDELLTRARQQGLNWGPIAAKYFPDKTANACRKRHERLMEKKTVADSFGEARMQELAKQYLEVREEMWRILAERLGEKWTVVEAKCMEKGLKNLTTTDRRARNRGDRNRTSDDLSNSLLHSGRSRSRSGDNNHSEGLSSPYSRGNNDDPLQQAPFSAGGLTGTSSNRSYSPNRTLSESTGTTSYYMRTPTVTASPQFQSPKLPFLASPIATTSSPWQQQPPPPLVDPPTKDPPQRLPSFSDSFSGLPSVIAGNLARSGHFSTLSGSSGRLPVTTE